jgi:hypothetical protein
MHPGPFQNASLVVGCRESEAFLVSGQAACSASFGVDIRSVEVVPIEAQQMTMHCPSLGADQPRVDRGCVQSRAAEPLSGLAQ